MTQDFWNYILFPPIPSGTVHIAEATAEVDAEVNFALQILRLFPERNRYLAAYGVNRKAQNRWPDRRIVIEEVSAIFDSWVTAGLEGLVEMVREGKISYSERPPTHHPVSQSLQSMMAAEITTSDDDEVFVSAGFVVASRRVPDLIPKHYRVTAVTQFGRYLFTVAKHEPPDQHDARHFCRLHTRRPAG